VAFVRTVKTASGARAVQIVYSRRQGARRIEHIGSAHDEVELELLKAAARQRIAAADAGMVSEANRNGIDAAKLSYMLAARIPYVPYAVDQWRREHPDTEMADGLILTQPWPATDTHKAQGRPNKVIYYQYKHDRARRTLRGIDEQVAKAEKAPVKRNRFITLAGGQKSVNRDLEAKARALAGWKGYADAAIMPRSVGSLLVAFGYGAGSSA